MKKTALFFLKFYVEASIHVALAVYALLQIFIIRHRLVYDENLMYSIFYGTIFSYNFVKYAPIAKLHHRSLSKNLKLIQLFSLGCFLLMIYYLLQLPWRTLTCIFSGAFLTFIYAIPLLQFKNMRNIPGCKAYLVSGSWVIAAVITPFVHFELPINSAIYIECIQIILLVFVLLIPFDIRDLQFDDPNLRTLPQRLGIKKSKQLGVFLIACFSTLFIYNLELKLFLSALLISVITSILILFSKNNQSKYYSSFFVETIPILWWLFLILLY